jgi:hypothetical protein
LLLKDVKEVIPVIAMKFYSEILDGLIPILGCKKLVD